MYSDLYLKKRSRWPFYVFMAFLVVCCVGGLIYGGIYFFPSLQNIQLFPEKKVSVERHEIVNMSPYEAGVFWLSNEKEKGWVVYGTKETLLRSKVYDERDTSEKQGGYLLHNVALKGLQPDTVYYYKIITERGVVLENVKKPFSFKTPKKETGLTTSKEPLYGKISLPKGTPAQDAFVFLYYDDIYPLLTRTKSSGEWLLPLQTLIDKSTGKYISLGKDHRIRLEVMNEDLLFSKVETTIRRASPVSKTVSLGKNYVFDSQKGTVLSEVSEQRGVEGGGKISLHHPKEGAVIPGLRPLIKGTAFPDNSVHVTIKGNQDYVFEVRADKRGQWRVPVSTDLSPGSHLLIVKTNNASGKEEIIRRYFIISKQGEQVLGDATESGELSPSPVPTEEEEVSPTVTLRPTEEPDDEPSPSPTKKPTATPSPYSTARPTYPSAPSSVPTATSMPVATKLPTYAPRVTDPLVQEEKPGEKQEPPIAGGIDESFILMTIGVIIIGAGIVFVL